MSRSLNSRSTRPSARPVHTLQVQRSNSAALFLSGAALLVACAAKKPQEGKETPTVPPTAATASTGPAPKEAPVASATPSAPAVSAVASATPPPVPEGPKSYFAPLAMQAPVFSEMEYPHDGKRDKRPPNSSVRIGYLRNGNKAPVIPEPHVKGNCPQGWYELEAGGYVCGKFGTLDLESPNVKAAPHPPFIDQPLPYQYGFNTENGTPLYRKVPTHAERVDAEPWRKRHKKPAEAPADGEPKPEGEAPPPAEGQAAAAPPSGEKDSPWYLRDWGTEKPKVTLDDLRGDGSMVSRRMVRGFYLSLDKFFISQEARWWRTSSGSIVSADRVNLTKLRTDFHGVWLDGRPNSSPTNLPIDGNGAGGITQSAANFIGDAGVTETPAIIPLAEGRPVAAFVMGKQGAKYMVSADRKKAGAVGPLPHFAGAALTGVSATVAGQVYFETADRWWFREHEGVVLRTSAAPTDLAPGEKWIDVSLKAEGLVAYEGDKPVYATLVSTGKTSRDREQDHRTPAGTYRIQAKHIASTMDGDVASDGPYSIEDVPWIMYFKGSYALHGAFWHTNFGHVQSHGCVNLAPNDARSLFGWTLPLVPEGWHGVFATDSTPGTRVIVRD